MHKGNLGGAQFLFDKTLKYIQQTAEPEIKRKMLAVPIEWLRQCGPFFSKLLHKRSASKYLQFVADSVNVAD